MSVLLVLNQVFYILNKIYNSQDAILNNSFTGIILDVFRYVLWIMTFVKLVLTDAKMVKMVKLIRLKSRMGAEALTVTHYV